MFDVADKSFEQIQQNSDYGGRSDRLYTISSEKKEESSFHDYAR